MVSSHWSGSKPKSQLFRGHSLHATSSSLLDKDYNRRGHSMTKQVIDFELRLPWVFSNRSALLYPNIAGQLNTLVARFEAV